MALHPTLRDQQQQQRKTETQHPSRFCERYLLNVRYTDYSTEDNTRLRHRPRKVIPTSRVLTTVTHSLLIYCGLGHSLIDSQSRGMRLRALSLRCITVSSKQNLALVLEWEKSRRGRHTRTQKPAHQDGRSIRCWEGGVPDLSTAEPPFTRH